QVTAQESLSGIVAIYHGAQLLGEAVPGNHAPGSGSGTFQVVGSTGGDIIQNQVLGHTAAQQADNILPHGSAGHIAGILIRQIHGITAGLATGNNADLMNRVVGGAAVTGD